MSTKTPEFAKNGTIATPIGTAVFPWLTKADTKFDDDGVYHTSLALDPKDPAAKAFLDKLGAIVTDAKAAMKAAGITKYKTHDIVTKEVVDEVETGNVLIKCKTNAMKKGKDGRKAAQNLTIVDSKKKPHPQNVPVYGGSRIRIAVYPAARYMQGTLYITLYIVSVQVVELQSGGGGTDMFDEEDGYAADQAADSDPFGSDDDDDDDEDDSPLY